MNKKICWNCRHWQPRNWAGEVTQTPDGIGLCRYPRIRGPIAHAIGTGTCEMFEQVSFVAEKPEE